MMEMKTFEVLDQEWITLIHEAKQLGLTIRDIKEYLSLHSTEQK
ncbi:anti-repressor SinI family protein [Alkalihalobacterium bogoriense]|nr:anti-repressor SinI family protein [Alkalihalobacterium bogoriense]